MVNIPTIPFDDRALTRCALSYQDYRTHCHELSQSLHWVGQVSFDEWNPWDYSIAKEGTKVVLLLNSANLCLWTASDAPCEPEKRAVDFKRILYSSLISIDL